MSDAKVAFYRSIGLTGALPDMERDFFEGSFRKVPYVLAQAAVPVCLAPNGTVATNGIITLGTALPLTYSGGIWLRLPANAVGGGTSDAGLYWTVMTSTTQGQVYTEFADTSAEFIPFVPSGALTPAIGSNLAYTQTTGSEIILVNVTLPASSLGVDGVLRIQDLWSYFNSAGSKTLRTKIGTAAIKSAAVTTTSTYLDIRFLRMRGTESRGIVFTPATNLGASTSLVTEITPVDTSLSQSITETAQIAVATDFVISEGFVFEILPS